MAGKQIVIKELELMQGDSMSAQFYTPQYGTETIIAKLPGNTIDEMYMHRAHTDQLIVIKNNFVLVVLLDGKYHYYPLSNERPSIVTIPPMVMHGAINLNAEPCVMVNVVVRHSAPHKLDYVAMKRPFDYDLNLAKTLMQSYLNET